MLVLVALSLLVVSALIAIAVKGQADYEEEKMKYEHSLHANQ